MDDNQGNLEEPIAELMADREGLPNLYKYPPQIVRKVFKIRLSGLFAIYRHKVLEKKQHLCQSSSLCI